MRRPTEPQGPAPATLTSSQFDPLLIAGRCQTLSLRPLPKLYQEYSSFCSLHDPSLRSNVTSSEKPFLTTPSTVILPRVPSFAFPLQCLLLLATPWALVG